MMTPVMAMAVQAHELFEALKSAGFDRVEALEVVIRLIMQANR